MRKLLFIPLFFLLLVISVKADTNISTCTALTTAGETYYLTADIIDFFSVTVNKCMNISANNVILDCQGHTIDGVDNADTYGIYVYRSSATTTNITIKNCISTDWKYGIFIEYSNSNNLSNIIANSNQFGIFLDSSNYNTLSNITANSNYYEGIGLIYPRSNIVKSSKFQDNICYGIYFFYSVPPESCDSYPANLIYNNFFNNTVNLWMDGGPCYNNWNTTRQTGTRIYSNGTEIGGNYWTNPSGNGYSDTCTDADKDGFCDSPYTLTTDNVDYLALSDEYVTPTCNCTEWMAENCVSGTQRKYTRICTPSGCDVEVKYETDTSCTAPTEYPWLTLLNSILSPFWLIMLITFGMSAGIEKKLNSGGIAFIVSFIIFSIIFSVLTRQMPFWIPVIVIILIVGFIVLRGTR
jgi:parallel beta-helix repeat protein